MAEHWLNIIGADLSECTEYIVDSCPIILAKGPRSGHARVARRPGLLPLPLSLMASGAAQHDLPAAKHILEDHLSLRFGRLYADKAYIDADWAESLEKNRALTLLTPRKKAKGDVLLSGDTFSTFVSSLRQPVECFFNWLDRLTNIQSASVVRSLSGLLLHIFARIAAALAALLFNS